MTEIKNTNRRKDIEAIKLIVAYQEVTKDEKQTPVGLKQQTSVCGDMFDHALHLKAAQSSANTLFVDVVSVEPA